MTSASPTSITGPAIPAGGRVRKAAILLAILLSLPSLWIGFVMDDYGLISLIEEWHTTESPINLYEPLLYELHLPWWTVPELKISFWRPLSSALLRMDHALFGRFAAAYHAHSLIWLAALMVICGLIYGRMTGRLASWALLILALDECHGLAAGWIANRHALVATVLGLVGLWAHLRWREDGWRPGAALSVIALAVALLAGESAFGVIAYVVAYEVFAGPAGRRRRIGDRLTGLLPVVLLVTAYLVWYRVGEFGVVGSGFYLDPSGSPSAFVAGALERAAVLLAGALAALPADLWMFPAMRSAQLVVGVVAVLGLAAVLSAAWPGLEPQERRALRWLIPGTLASLAPAALSLPSDRMLLAPMIGLAVALAAVFDFARQRRRQADGRARRWAAGSLLTLLIVLHFGLAPAGRIAAQLGLKNIDGILTRIAEQVPLDASAGPSDVVLIQAPDAFTMYYTGLIRGFHHGPDSMSWHVLSLAPYDHSLIRTGPRDFELQTTDGQMLGSFLEQMLRSPRRPLSAGDTVKGNVFDVEILENNARGPTRIAIHGSRSLESPDLVFLVWAEDGLKRFSLPAVGERVDLERFPGLIAGF